MRENNVQTHTDAYADASVELFTYDSECSLVRWRTRVIQEDHLPGRWEHSARKRPARRGEQRRGPVRERSTHDQHVPSLAKITIGIASPCPLPHRQVNETDSPRDRTQENEGREKTHETHEFGRRLCRGGWCRPEGKEKRQFEI